MATLLTQHPSSYPLLASLVRCCSSRHTRLAYTTMSEPTTPQQNDQSYQSPAVPHSVQRNNKRKPNTSTATSSSASASITAYPSPSPSLYDHSNFCFTDIGANLLDDMYGGYYHSQRRHAPDRDKVLERAQAQGVTKLIITSGTHNETKAAIEFIQSHKQPALHLYTTCGIHPTRSSELLSFTQQQYEQHFSDMLQYIQSHPSIIAIGECGLDADRTHFSSMEQQRRVFPYHLTLAQQTGLPLFLHDRNTQGELYETVKHCQSSFPTLTGVAHSFTGSLTEMQHWCALGWYIGVNGCSLKTEENLNVVRSIPSSLLLLETDSPWCEIKPTHASYPYVKTRFPSARPEQHRMDCMVKHRNEPCAIICVAEVVAAVRGISVAELNEQVAQNTQNLFFSKRQTNSGG